MISINKIKLEKYNPISKLKKTIGYSLIGFGVVTFPIPSGSQLSIIAGASLIGIPKKELLRYTNHYLKELGNYAYCMRDKKSLCYELNRIRVKLR